MAFKLQTSEIMNEGKGDCRIWDYSRDQVRLKLLQHSGIVLCKYAEYVLQFPLPHLKKKKSYYKKLISDTLIPFVHNKRSDDSLENSSLSDVHQFLPHFLSGRTRQERLYKS